MDRGGRFSVWVGCGAGSTGCLDVGIKERDSRKCPGASSEGAIFCDEEGWEMETGWRKRGFPARPGLPGGLNPAQAAPAAGWVFGARNFLLLRKPQRTRGPTAGWGGTRARHPQGCWL